MKIIGFTSFDENEEMLLKGDSCLLVNRKPFFRPDDSNDLRAIPCVVLRVSRLGKSVAARFADRYFDAFAYGFDFVAWDKLTVAQQNGKPWTEATCFDYSLAVGDWLDKEHLFKIPYRLSVSPAEAIERVSHLMTIRQGDLIYIHAHAPARSVTRDDMLQGPEGAEDSFYCKIK